MQPKGCYLITSQTGLRVIQGTPKSLHRQSLGVRDVWYTRFLTLCRMLQLKAYERAKTSANHAYSKSKALALQRLNSRNNQLLRGSVSGGSSVSNPQPSSAAATAAPPTPEAVDDRASFPDDGKPPGANWNTSVRCTVVTVQVPRLESALAGQWRSWGHLRCTYSMYNTIHMQ